MQSFTFLHKYKKYELVRYLAGLFLCEQNSSHIIQLSNLVYHTLADDGGNTPVIPELLAKDISGNYPFEPMEDTQNFMYVDAVHTEKGTFRVFPGNFAYVQYDLTRLFMIAMSKKINEDLFGEVYALLELSDEIAERCGFGRYERGESNYEELYLADDQEAAAKSQMITFTKSEIEAVYSKYGLGWGEAQLNVYKEDREKIEAYYTTMSCYSPIETTPFYQLGSGDYVVIEPSSLMTSAYLRCLAIMRSLLHEQDLQDAFREIIKSEFHRSIKYADNMCVGAEIFNEVDCLIYHFDANKVARICFTAYRGYEKGIKKCDEYVAKEWPGKEVMKIHIISSLDFENCGAFPFDEMTVTVDDIKVILANEHGMLTGLYDYYTGRNSMKGVAICCGDADMYGYYCFNKKTFYQDRQVSMLSLASDFFFDLKCNHLQNRDQHLIDYAGQKMMVRHLDELPLKFPIFEPDTESQVPVLIGEYRQASIVCCFAPNNKDEYNALREISKALLVRLFVYEHRHQEALLVEGNYRMEVCFVDGTTVLFKPGPQDFLFTISKKFFEKDYQGKTDEQALFDFFLEKLNHYGYLSPLDYRAKSQLIFDECDGQLLLTDKNGLPYWQIHDKYDTSYRVNEHKCDEVLEDLARHLNRKGKRVVLSLEESKKLAFQIVEFLWSEIDKILSANASREFVLHLLELHHATLFWLATTQIRFEKVNALMEYVGTTFEGQKELLFGYSETNNLTQAIIERIITKGFCTAVKTKDFQLEQIDRLYALMHELYIYGSYIDMLVFNIPGLEMGILSNGRVGLPHEKIDEQMKYFMDLRENELHRPEGYRKLHCLQNTPNIDIKDIEFRNAFKAEFKIEFDQWRKIIESSLDYAFVTEQPVVDITWETYETDVLLKVLGKSEITAFHNTFCLYNGMNAGAMPSESFAQRFNRKYQLSSRPWVCYNGRLMYSTKSLHQHEHVMMDRLNEGKVHAESKEMESYMGEVNSKKGVEFEKNLKCFFETLGFPYIHAFRGVKIGPGERLENEEMIGDIDVLLINTDKKRIACLETKDYAESRTIFDMLTQGRKTGDDMEMPLKRDGWCQKHIISFKSLCSEVDDSYTCTSVFVTVNMPAYLYSHVGVDSPIRMIPALDIMENPMVVFDE